jgi:pyroglutamyl-peptidase
VAKHVLITAFEPFGGEQVNPSELVARRLEGRTIAGRPVRMCILPVQTMIVRERLEHAIATETADIVICMGQAGGRTAISLERLAVNHLDFSQPDNAGIVRRSEPIARNGPDVRLSPLPFEEILTALSQRGIPGYVSNSAGTYICNQTLYEVLDIAERASPPITAGFVHLPYLPEQAARLGAETTPSMGVELMTRAIEILIETVVARVDAPQKAALT